MKIYFITSNEGKFREVKNKLGVLPQLDLERLEHSYPEVQADSLEEVVKFALDWLQKSLDYTILKDSVMIEDSGLFVERLKGFPGVYSAYVFKTIGGYNSVLTLMEGEWDRRARFETCIGMITSDGQQKLFAGKCEGSLTTEGIGTEGFGYDPIFMPEGEKRTFAEMTTPEKNRFSHRSKALDGLQEYLSQLD
jgi:XTP/dITP diphosphohydrolase